MLRQLSRGGMPAVHLGVQVQPGKLYRDRVLQDTSKRVLKPSQAGGRQKQDPNFLTRTYVTWRYLAIGNGP